MKYIDAEKIRSEVERIKETGCESPISVCNDILSFIDSLQQEQPDIDIIKREWYNKGYLKGRKESNIPARELGLPKSCDMQEQPSLPGIEENGIPGKDFIPVGWVDACENYGKWKIVKVEQPEVDLEEELDKFYGMYRKDGKTYDITDDEEVGDWKEDGNSWFKIEFARHFYELGLNARKEG